MRGVLHLLQEYHSNYSDKKGYYGYYMRKRCWSGCVQGDGGGVYYGTRNKKQDTDPSAPRPMIFYILKKWLKEHGLPDYPCQSWRVRAYTGSPYATYWKIPSSDAHQCTACQKCSGKKTDVKDSGWFCKLLRSGTGEGKLHPTETVRELTVVSIYNTEEIFINRTGYSTS